MHPILFAALSNFIITASATPSTPQLKDVAVSDICFLDNVVVVDLAAAGKTSPIQEDYSSAAELKLSELLEAKAPKLPRQATISQREHCRYSGMVAVSLFPPEGGKRFFIARYFLSEGRVNRADFQQAILTKDTSVFKGYSFPLEIEQFHGPFSEADISRSISDAAINVLNLFLLNWQGEIIYQ
ncbi:hypothetical protein E5F05_09690 [Deinococcus metallilatus]|uniref:Uncharacterized protein n=1 Tax=Deinococcus metallilatus TaxID=1211322 RepID=A0AAJ5JZQ6_9DEIO|nr:hypothetical protein [Deinococcus metallilatus]MBB5295989.1 hypothetical protein [Deinococcus metallilatus]QBY08189.1 hypothetical protein E5F05_09690 [Deinococcus metallilatus]RXJ11921.1 hypothetical protein ERJ73_08500 [Deinococcus metallilatus]TLK25847.1 hypothetical protein FCS05_12480 [Deinococcus metallilatus]GMA14476.1 hypothetical protein GCM10025871_08070 [Deinococcus metallilatus]